MSVRLERTKIFDQVKVKPRKTSLSKGGMNIGENSEFKIDVIH